MGSVFCHMAPLPIFLEFISPRTKRFALVRGKNEVSSKEMQIDNRFIVVGIAGIEPAAFAM